MDALLSFWLRNDLTSTQYVPWNFRMKKSVKPYSFISAVLIVVICFTAVFPLDSLAQPNLVTIEAIGSSEIVDAKIEDARELAITSGLTDAINQVANGLVPQEGMLQFFTELNQTVFSDVQSYIQGYKVIDEWITENEYHVKVEAIVSVDTVKQSLANAGVIKTRKTLPRVLLLISEQKTSDPAPLYWWDITDRNITPVTETALAQQLNDAGFSLTRHEDIPIPAQWIDLRQTPNLTDKQSVRLGSNSSAQVLIVGSAQVQTTRFIQFQKKELRGTIDLRAIRIDNGEQIAGTYQTSTLTENDGQTGNQEVLSLLATLAGKDLTNQMMAIWPKIAQNPTQIAVLINGTHNLSASFNFRKSLENIPDVSAVLISEFLPDQTRLRVDYKGDSRTLARAIADTTYDGFTIMISEIKTSSIQIQLSGAAPTVYDGQ